MGYTRAEKFMVAWQVAYSGNVDKAVEALRRNVMPKLHATTVRVWRQKSPEFKQWIGECRQRLQDRSLEDMLNAATTRAKADAERDIAPIGGTRAEVARFLEPLVIRARHLALETNNLNAMVQCLKGAEIYAGCLADSKPAARTEENSGKEKTHLGDRLAELARQFAFVEPCKEIKQ